MNRIQPSVYIKEGDTIIGIVHFQPFHKRITQKIRNIWSRFVAILTLTVIFGSIASTVTIIGIGLIN